MPMPRPALGETWASCAARTGAGSAGEALSIAASSECGWGSPVDIPEKAGVGQLSPAGRTSVRVPTASTAPPPGGPPAFVTARDTASARLPNRLARRARQLGAQGSYRTHGL